MSAFDLVRRFGVRIVEVPGLAEDTIYVHDRDLALVRAELGPEGRTAAAQWLLSEALAERLTT